MSRRTICGLDDLGEGSPLGVEIDGVPIVVVRVGDRVFALDGLCTHQAVSLVDGEVDLEECLLECPKHGAAFRLDDGSPVSLPATRPVRTWPVTIDGGNVSVDMASGDAT